MPTFRSATTGTDTSYVVPTFRSATTGTDTSYVVPTFRSATTGPDTSYVVPTFRSAVPNGHAIEVRVYAENPDEGFLPSPGRITHLRPPSGPGIRDDSGVYEGWTVPTAYDPLVSKVVAWAPDRSGAIARMDRALAEYDLRGINTTIAFCRDLVRSTAFADAAFDTTYVDRLLDENGKRGAQSDGLDEIVAMAAAMWLAGEAGLKASTTKKASTTNRPALRTRPDYEQGRSARQECRSADLSRPRRLNPSGCSAHGWTRCDERRCHGERPALEGRDRACRRAREAHRDDQRQDSRR